MTKWKIIAIKYTNRQLEIGIRYTWLVINHPLLAIDKESHENAWKIDYANP